MVSLSWLEFVVLILASFRLTRLIVYDEITSFLREPFFSVTYEDDGTGQIVRHVHLKGSGLRPWIGTLLSCHWCVGMWVAAAIVGIYCWFPSFFPLLLIIAVAGAASIVEAKLFLN